MTTLLRFQLIGATLCSLFVVAAVVVHNPNDDTLSVILGVIATIVAGVVFIRTATTPSMTRALQERVDELQRLRAENASLRVKAARWDAIETLMIVGDVELKQAEDGGYIISLDPVENIVAQSWEGDTPDQVVDKVVTKLAAEPRALKGL